MYYQPVPKMQQSRALEERLHAEAGRTGWRLDDHSALSFKAPVSGVLRVERGRVWATADGPHSGPLNDWGDVVLASGDQWPLAPGQRLVIEPWALRPNDTALISWEPCV